MIPFVSMVTWVPGRQRMEEVDVSCYMQFLSHLDGTEHRVHVRTGRYAIAHPAEMTASTERHGRDECAFPDVVSR
jgi:hypothetical protein